MSRFAPIMVLVACSGLEVTERDICGNNIVEQGEDCDGAEYCDACAILCDANRDCPGFEGYFCGSDDRCHAPGGEFDPVPATHAFSANEVVIRDIDRDRVGDIIGVGTTSLETLFGDAGASLTRRSRVVTPAVQGAFAVADLLDDKSVEIVIPTVDGIVSYSSEFGSFAAEPFPSDLTGDPAIPLALIALDPDDPLAISKQTRLGVFSSEPPDTLVFKVVDVITGERPMDEHPICGASEGEFVFDSYSIVTPGRVEFVSVVVVTPPAPGIRRACAFSMVQVADTYTFVDLPLAITPTGSRPVLVDVTDGDNACPSLVLPESTNGVFTYVPGALVTLAGNTVCGFGAARPTIVVSDIAAGVKAVGRLRLEPPIAGAGPEALVLEAGVFPVVAGNQAAAIYRSNRPIARIVAADLDLDGKLDAITTGTSDVEVLLRAPPLMSTEGFLPIRIPTAGIPANLVIGDFDGNGRPDVVFTESVGGSDRISIAHGTPDRLLDPVHVASFGEVLSIALANVTDTSDPTAVVLDLAVLDRIEGANKKNRVTALHGSPARTLIPLFTPVGALGQPERFHAVVAGELDGNTLGDLLAIDRNRAVPGGFGAMWRLRGEAETLANEDVAVTSRIDDCPALEGGLCSTARYLVHGGRVIMFDAFGLGGVFDPAPDFLRCDQPPPDHDQCEPSFVSPTRRLTDEMAIAPRTPLAFDIGNDGSTEIVVAFTRQSNPRLGGVLVCDAALASECAPLANLVIETDRDVVACTDAAIGTLAAGGRDLPAPLPELIVLCHTDDEARLFRVESTTRVTRIEGFAASSETLSLQIGDVTGDEVDDIVLVKSTSEGRVLQVVRQRTSREVSSL